MSEREDVEALAKELERFRKGGVGLSPVGAKIGAQGVLKSDWLAAHVEAVRVSERVRLAEEVDALIETLPRNEFGDQYYLAVEAAYANAVQLLHNAAAHVPVPGVRLTEEE